jgi:hypothetical protein
MKNISNVGMGTTVIEPVPMMNGLKPERYDFMKEHDNPLSDKERKYCRCLLRVENSTVERYGNEKYNPYAVCNSRVHASVRSCSPYYDWSVMGLSWLIAYADLHKINLTDRSSRESVLGQIEQWKKSRGETL